ncbi:MAG: hypothetical protein COA78_31035 [Blastopirellula sp.]|nr:MAG: hypothetical protein COA78_31035 [Blastopirellula sp.]
MKLFRNLMLLSLVLLVAAPLAAQDAKKKGKGRTGANPGMFNNAAKLDLNAEQKEKLAALKKEFTPKLAELRKKSGQTAETRKARAAAIKEATEKGLKGKKRQEFLDSKVPVTEEQKKVRAEVAKLTKEIKAKLASFLTKEQMAKLNPNAAAKKPAAAPKKKKGKKPADK